MEVLSQRQLMLPLKIKKKRSLQQKLKKHHRSTTTANTSNGRIFASPLAKKIAADKGYQLSDIIGSGENGRIIKKDVENYTPTAKTVEVVKTETASPAVAYVLLAKKNQKK